MTPEAAAVDLFAYKIGHGYKQTALHTYTSADGSAIYWRVRMEHPTAEKFIRPFKLNGTGYEVGEPKFPNGKPLYGLHLLAQHPDAHVWLVEGEICADVLRELGLVAVTAGSQSSDVAVDVEPLRGCTVIAWPDNDKVGLEHMGRMRKRLLPIDCKLRGVRLDALGLAEGEDCVDWLKAHPNATAADVMALVDDEEASPEADPEDDLEQRRELLKLQIKRLVKLSPTDYELERGRIAKACGIRADALDKIVKEARGEDAEKPLYIREALPAEEAVPLAEILDAARQLFADHLIAPPHAYCAAALWVAWTWCYEHGDYAPILLFKSPTKRCGKTTALSIIHKLARRPLSASNITSAALFRSIEKFAPTLLLDEADTFLKQSDELRGVVNSGHTRDTAFVIRNVGDNHDPQPFAVFGPKVLALIGRAPDTVEDRSVIVHMKRKLKSERVKKLASTPAEVWAVVQSNFARWGLDHGHQIAKAQPAIPDSLNDREGDSWTPLLAIADLAGGEWPKLARAAAVGLSGEDEADIDTLLLTDIRGILDRLEWDPISSAELIAELVKNKEQPWATFNRGHEMSQSQLSKRLSKFSVVSRTVRTGIEKTPKGKGWPRKAFDDAFTRYLPFQSVTPLQASNGAACDGFTSVTHESDVTDAKASQASNGAGYDDVTLANTPNGEDDEMKLSTHWFVHYSDKDSADVYFGAAVDLAQVLAEYPDAIAAEPIAPAEQEQAEA